MIVIHIIYSEYNCKTTGEVACYDNFNINNY